MSYQIPCVPVLVSHLLLNLSISEHLNCGSLEPRPLPFPQRWITSGRIVGPHCSASADWRTGNLIAGNASLKLIQKLELYRAHTPPAAALMSESLMPAACWRSLPILAVHSNSWKTTTRCSSKPECIRAGMPAELSTDWVCNGDSKFTSKSKVCAEAAWQRAQGCWDPTQTGQPVKCYQHEVVPRLMKIYGILIQQLPGILLLVLRYLLHRWSLVKPRF